MIICIIDMICALMCSSHRLISRRNRASRSIFASLQGPAWFSALSMTLLHDRQRQSRGNTKDMQTTPRGWISAMLLKMVTPPGAENAPEQPQRLEDLQVRCLGVGVSPAAGFYQHLPTARQRRACFCRLSNQLETGWFHTLTLEGYAGRCATRWVENTPARGRIPACRRQRLCQTSLYQSGAVRFDHRKTLS